MRAYLPLEHLAGRRLICYGAGLALAGLLETGPLPVSYVVDDTPELQGKEFLGLPIRPSSALDGEQRDSVHVLVCASTPDAICGISASLYRRGFRFGHDFSDCSFLHFQTIGARLVDRLGLDPCYDRFFLSRMLSLNSRGRNFSTIAGTWLFVELLEHLCAATPGDVAECGVFEGGNAFAALMVSPTLRGRPYHLLDSFQGFSELSMADPAARKDDFRNVNMAQIRQTFDNFPNVQIHRGFFRETLPGLSARQFGLVYIDCDLYEPAKLCLEFFFPRICHGGCLLLHDYWVPKVALPQGSREVFPGIERAVRETLPNDLHRVIVFPETLHALIVKE